MIEQLLERYDLAPLPSEHLPWREGSYCAVDLETTGLDWRSDEIVSYAAVPIDDGRVSLDGAVAGLVRPQAPIPADAVRIHGIRSSEVAHAPSPQAMLEALLPCMTGRLLVVHVDWVERGFLGRGLAPHEIALREPILDTSRLAQAVWPPTSRFRELEHLSQKLGLPSYGRHEALGDAVTTAQAFVALAGLLDRSRTLTVRDLIAASGGGGPTVKTGLGRLLSRL